MSIKIFLSVNWIYHTDKEYFLLENMENYYISFLALALGEKGVFNAYKKISMLHICS
jgi:hypothetical protein